MRVPTLWGLPDRLLHCGISVASAARFMAEMGHCCQIGARDSSVAFSESGGIFVRRSKSEPVPEPSSAIVPERRVLLSLATERRYRSHLNPWIRNEN